MGIVEVGKWLQDSVILVKDVIMDNKQQQIIYRGNILYMDNELARLS